MSGWGAGAARVAIVDDHQLVGVALGAALTGHPTLSYVGSAATVDELLRAGGTPEIIVLDLRLGDGSSPISNADRLHAAGATVVGYTSGESPWLIRLAARAAISGLVLKSQPIAVLVDALERCANGAVAFSTDWAAAISTDTGLDRAGLSAREREVLALMASGMPAKAIAARLGIAVPTLEVHVRRLRDKYARVGRPAATRGELVYRALEDGHLPLPGDPG